VIYNARGSGFHPGRMSAFCRKFLIENIRFACFSKRDLAQKHKNSLIGLSASIPKIRCIIESLRALQACINSVAEHSSGAVSGVGGRNNQTVF
jgi:hypothetical protein